MTLRQRIQELDREDMLGKVLAMPEQLQQAWRANSEVRLPFTAGDIDQIVIAGMGGSAISGDVISSIFQTSLSKPIFVNRQYDLPEWVGVRTLVIVSSYSGNTEESLSAMDIARERNARLVCVTGGGKLGEDAADAQCPIFTLPSGYPPRSALVFLAVPLLQILTQLDLISNMREAIEEAAATLQGLRGVYGPDNESSHNIPLLLAQKVAHKLPVIYAGAGLLSAAALRWRGQLCENAEMLAYGNLFPEMNHNEIVGWGQAREFGEMIQVIYLRDREDHPRIKLRMDIVRDLIEAASNPIVEIWSEGEGRLARMFSVIFTGDLLSVYAAVLRGLDPTPVQKIDYLKEELSKKAS